MNRTSLAVGLAFALSISAASRGDPQQSTATITGSVIDRATRNPVSGAVILVAGSRTSVRSDAQGRFSHPGLAGGAHVLRAHAIGYRAGLWIVLIEDGEVLDHILELQPAAEELAAVLVEGHTERWMAGFLERRARGRGHFLNAQEIAATGGSRLTDVLRNVPGVHVICRGRRCQVQLIRSPRRCPPDFVLDGFSATNSVTPEMPLAGVIGIEIYRSLSETPMQFIRADNLCGTIVIWTKSGP